MSTDASNIYRPTADASRPQGETVTPDPDLATWDALRSLFFEAMHNVHRNYRSDFYPEFGEAADDLTEAVLSVVQPELDALRTALVGLVEAGKPLADGALHYPQDWPDGCGIHAYAGKLDLGHLRRLRAALQSAKDLEFQR